MEGISAVIAARDAAGTIGETLRALGRAGKSVVSATVVLDGCTDATAAETKAWSRDLPFPVRTLETPGIGVSGARNLGTAHVDGDVLWFVDADDLPEEGSADRLAAAISGDPEAAVAFGNFTRINADGSPAGSRSLVASRARRTDQMARRLMLNNVIAVPGIAAVRKRLLLDAGGFPEDITHGEDWVAFFRLASRGRFIHVPHSVLRYRLSPAGATMSSIDPSPYMRAVAAIYSSREATEAEPDPGMRRRMKAAAEAGLMVYLAQQALRRKSPSLAPGLLWKAFCISPFAAARAFPSFTRAIAGF